MGGLQTKKVFALCTNIDFIFKKKKKRKWENSESNIIFWHQLRNEHIFSIYMNLINIKEPRLINDKHLKRLYAKKICLSLTAAAQIIYTIYWKFFGHISNKSLQKCNSTLL